VAAESKDRPTFPRLLICEGPKDRLFFHRLIHARNLPGFHLFHSGGRTDRGGNSRFAEAIRAFQISRTKTYNSLRDIVIVADNDETPDASFQNVRNQIEVVFGSRTAPAEPLRRTTNVKPAISVLMIPWTGQIGHLEKLCMDSANAADRGVGDKVDTFMAMIAAERWKNESRFAKAWLRSNLAARCADPFVPLGHVFEEQKYLKLIPVDHTSFDNIANFLGSFALIRLDRVIALTPPVR
jgi:hypothetical protein